MPEVFRLLYGCGFRAGEVLKLRIRDVDLNQGIITVRQAKCRKDRLVPPALPLVNRLRKYAAHFEKRPPDAIFFPRPNGGPFSLRTVYTLKGPPFGLGKKIASGGRFSKWAAYFRQRI